MFNYKTKRISMLITIITALFIFFSCQLGRLDNTLTGPADIPESLTGEALESRNISVNEKTAAASSNRAIEDWETTFAKIEDEYGSFFLIALVAYNYSQPFERQKTRWDDLINDPATDWTALTDGGAFTQEVQDDEGGGMFRTNESFTEWEYITVEPGDDKLRRHLRVSEKEGYTHTTLVMWSIGGFDSNDTIDIVETDDYKIIRCLTAADLNGDGTNNSITNPLQAGGVIEFNEFYAITKKDSAEHTLGIRRARSATISTALEYVMDTYDSSSDEVGAFDNTQLLVRPDTYPEPLTDLSVGMELTSQGESFDSTLFPTLAEVQKLLSETVGFTPTEVANAVIYDDFTYNYEVPDWGPVDIGLE